MLSTKQKAVYLGTGGALVAASVWLRYADSASSARSSLGKAGRRMSKTSGRIYETMVKIRHRVVEADRVLCELARIGNEQKDRAQTVFNDTLSRFRETTAVIQKNLTQTSNEISALVKDIRAAMNPSVLAKPSKAA
jgi:gas vesicle protein